jgi:hypothetical protein
MTIMNFFITLSQTIELRNKSNLIESTTKNLNYLIQTHSNRIGKSHEKQQTKRS